MRVLAACGLAVAIWAVASPAHAQMETREGIALQNQILELRRDVQNLREQAGRGGPPPSSSSTLGGGGRQGQGQISAGTMEMTATLLDRVTALEDQMRRLNGRIDELDNASQRRSADLAKQIGDIQFRLDNPTQGGGVKPAGTGSPAPASLGAVPASPVPPPPPVRRTPALALQEGNAALARRDYAAAEAAAREVLAAGKAAPGSYDAQFLLAQASFGSRNYPQAAIEYNNTFDRSRQGSHAEDSLLGLAVSLNALGEKRSACAALDSLRSQFPTPRADVAQRAAAARSQAGCR